MTDWSDRAACRGMPLTLFFGPEGERKQQRERREHAAKAICARCPARVECLDYALTTPEKYGVWGGMGEDERVTERRRRLRRAARERAA